MNAYLGYAPVNARIQRAPQALRWNDSLCRLRSFASDSEKRLGIGPRNGEQSPRGTTRLLAALFPTLKGAYRNTKQRGKL